MDSHNEMASLLFTNLQLLGMDVVAMEGKYHIPFNKEMFSLPNKAGSEAVLHFLFDRLNPALFKEQFRDCWPLYDRKAELQFRRVCITWLSSIQADDPDAHLPRINASLLMSPGGHKFIHLLYRFSTYVLIKTMTKEHGFKMQEALVYPEVHQPTSAYRDMMECALEDSCKQLQVECFEQLHLTVAANRKWKESADKQVKTYRRLSRAARDLENEKRQVVGSLAENAQKQGLSLPAKRTLSMFDSDEDVYSTKRSQRMEQARLQWKKLLDFSADMKDKREVLKSILDPLSEKLAVNGTNLGVRIPNLLLQEFQREIQVQEIDNVYIGGRLNLESVTFLWNRCLKRYKEQLKGEMLLDVISEIPAVKDQVQQHHAHLQAAQKTRDEIKNIALPQVQDEVEKLLQKLEKPNMAGKPQNESNNNPNLGLIAPTPPMTFPARGPQTGATPVGPFVTSKSKHDTPDAISSVVGKVEQSVGQTSKQLHVPKDLHLTSQLHTLKKSAKPVSTDKGQPQSGAIRSTRHGTHGTKPLKDHKDKPKVVHARPPQAGKSAQKKIKPSNDSALPVNSPITRKQNAEDLLATLMVDSVLNPNASDGDMWSSDLKSLSDNLFLESPLDLDQHAFTSKDLLARSPQQSPPISSHVPTTDKKSPQRDWATGSDQGERQDVINIYNSPLWEHTSPRDSGLKSPERSSGLFSPVWSSSAENNADQSTPAPMETVQDTSETHTFNGSVASGADSSRHDANTGPNSILGSPDAIVSLTQSGQEEGSKTEPWTRDESSTSSNLFNLEENANGQSSLYKSLPRFPGDGQTSRESLASTSSSGNGNDEVTEMESLSKDSLISPVLTKGQTLQPANTIDDLLFSASLGTSGHPDFAHGLPSNPTVTTSTDGLLREPICDEQGQLSSKSAFTSEKGLLDWDSGDDLVLGLDESFSPVKRGIVLESAFSPHRGLPESKEEEGSPDLINFSSDSFSAEGAATSVSSSLLDTKRPLHQPSGLSTSKESGSKSSMTQPGNSEYLTRLALLQRRFANIVTESSEDDH